MRRFGLIALGVCFACGNGGSGPSIPSVAEYEGIFGASHEVAFVRIAERVSGGAGVGAHELPLDAADVTARCRNLCEIGGECLGSNNVADCTRRCGRQFLGAPIGCVYPTLDALDCAVEALCFTPLNHRDRAREQALACDIEFRDVEAAQPGVVAGFVSCPLPEI